MKETPKHLRRVLRDLNAKAHEEALWRALGPLGRSFERWEAREISSGELTERIHEFHDGPSRELYKFYNGDHAWAVAFAIAHGILDPDDVPDEVMEWCKDMFERFRQSDAE